MISFEDDRKRVNIARLKRLHEKFVADREHILIRSTVRAAAVARFQKIHKIEEM
jgi:hypothetical protein